MRGKGKDWGEQSSGEGGPSLITEWSQAVTYIEGNPSATGSGKELARGAFYVKREGEMEEISPTEKAFPLTNPPFCNPSDRTRWLMISIQLGGPARTTNGHLLAHGQQGAVCSFELWGGCAPVIGWPVITSPRR